VFVFKQRECSLSHVASPRAIDEFFLRVEKNSTIVDEALLEPFRRARCDFSQPRLRIDRFRRLLASA
jgi:hypothetical protein